MSLGAALSSSRVVQQSVSADRQNYVLKIKHFHVNFFFAPLHAFAQSLGRS